MSRILLLEDDREIAEIIVAHLEARNHVVEWVKSGSDALALLRSGSYDAAIFDVVVEGMNGTEACRTYRKNGGNVPIIMLTGKDSLPDKIVGFESGADDYLTKPFSIEELVLRLNALVRRPRERLPEVLEVGELRLDLGRCQLTKGEEVIALSAKEFMLLEFLMLNRDHLFSPSELLDRLWRLEAEVTEAAVRKCFTRLRSKIDGDEEPGYLITVKGLGFKLTTPQKCAT